MLNKASFLCKKLKFYICIVILSCLTLNQAKADDSSDVNIARYLSCESGFGADALEYGLPYSCIDQPVFNMFFTSLLTAGMSTGALMRLKIHHEKLHPGNCLSANKADYNNPKISFSFCSNLKLIAQNTVAMFDSMFTGKSPMPDPSTYMNNYTSGPTSLQWTGDLVLAYGAAFAAFANPSIMMGVPTVLPVLFFGYDVAVNQDQICVNILTVAGSMMPLGCKYIKEPYPYAMIDQNDCSKVAESQSKTSFPISSKIVSCVRQAALTLVDGTLFSTPTGTVMTTTGSSPGEALADALSSNSHNNVIYRFQTNMQLAVTAILIIYLAILGGKFALSPEKIKNKDMINAVVKIIFVTYFSVGLNMHHDGGPRFDGISRFLMPLMLNGITELASWMMNGTSQINGLCQFPESLYSDSLYDQNMSLWDQIDCRLSFYIGYSGLVELLLNDVTNDPVNHQIPPYIFLAMPGVILGDIPLVMMALSYPIMILSFVAYSICLFVSGMIIIVIVGMLAPIFVPLLLFERTKEYFDKWWKTLLGVVLQPAIALAFMSIMFAVYDRAFYGTCYFNSVDVTYEARDGSRAIFRDFFISLDESDYTSAMDIDTCTMSLGYFLNNPVRSMVGSVDNPGISALGQAEGGIKINPKVTISQDDAGKIAAAAPTTEGGNLKGKNSPKLKWTNGLFTQSPKMFWEELVNIIKNLIMCYILLSVLKNLMNDISTFIVGISGADFSPMGNMTPGAIQTAITSAVEKGVSKMPKGGGKAGGKDGDKKGGDKEGGKGDGGKGGSRGGAGKGGEKGGAGKGGEKGGGKGGGGDSVMSSLKK